MSDINVSLIMAVYNTEKEILRKCIESILEQTCERWNLLIVDDGSKKEISEYCDSFSSDYRIRVIHQNNSGVSAARNNGTRYANGDYVMYIDSDDVLSPYAIEEALQYAEETNADIVFGGVCKIKQQDEFDRFSSLKGKFEIKDYKKDDFRKSILGSNVKGLSDVQSVGYIGRGPWAKLVKREIAERISFPSGYPIGEDLIWNLRLLNCCDRCVVANSIWYGYVIYQSSAISKYYGNREHIVAKWFEQIKNENAEFFSQNEAIQGQLLARELYSLIQYDFLSPQNSNSLGDKNHQIADLLNREPWCLLKNKAYCGELSIFQKLLLDLCRISLGATATLCYLKLKKLRT